MKEFGIWLVLCYSEAREKRRRRMVWQSLEWVRVELTKAREKKCRLKWASDYKLQKHY
jgi:hypothetical protein